MKQKCEHLQVDGWHVPTQEAKQIVHATGNPYGWRDQLRAEMTGDVSKWMWPGLLLLLAVGLLIRDWLMITGAAVAMVFFLYQAFTLVRTLRSSAVVTTRCRSIALADSADKEPTYCAQVRIDRQPQEIVIICQECIDALQDGTELELMVALDSDDPSNNWLVGFRPEAAARAITKNAKTRRARL